MTKKSNSNFSSADELELSELAKAAMSSPEVQAYMRKSGAKTINDLVGVNGALRNMFKPLVQDMLEAEMTEYIGYPKHDPAGYHSGNSRNGSYSRNINSSDGEFSLDIPRDRNGKFKPTVLPGGKHLSLELEHKIQSLYALGSSTSDITDFVKEMYGLEISDTFVSNVTASILDTAKQWQSRPLSVIYPIIYLDAIHIKCRQDGKVINKAVYVVMAYDLAGRKDILGHYISSGSEGAKYWLSVITDLKNRGVEDILIASIDGLAGFETAINAIFPNTIVQRCVVHAIRNSTLYVPNKLRREFIKDLKLIYKANTKGEAEIELKNLKLKYGEKYPMAINVWVNNWDSLSQFFDFTPEIRTMIYTTNPIESYNSVIRKYTKNKRSFNSNEALEKVLYIAYTSVSKKWDKSRANWQAILNELSIQFEERIPMNITY